MFLFTDLITTMTDNHKQNRPFKAPLHVYEKRLESIEEILAEMIQLASEDRIFIVEGKRDILALKKLGIDGHFEIATQRSLSNFCESIAQLNEKVIILTDWDRRGNMLMLKMTKHFHSLGVNPDLRIRERLISIVQKEIKDVESLPTYIIKLRQVAGNSTNSTFFTD
jgi:5S rRNA maturation endonuclease (ribonuclease M5)